jgi:alcohol dehydrogenase
MLTPTTTTTTTSDTPVSLPGSGVRVLFGAGTLAHLPAVVRSLGAKRVLLVTDPGIKVAGHVDRAVRALYQADLVVRVFDHADENPTTKTVHEGLKAAVPFKPDVIVGLGGGSSMDTAKGINFILTNGGRMQDYWGTNKAQRPMLPMVAIPTTTGTGSEAQSYALITDPETHQKMACGDEKALPKVAILDPDLTATQPPRVAAATGIDAITHAVETAGTTKRNEVSRRFSAEAWRLLNQSYETVVSSPLNPKDRTLNPSTARANMLLGAHLAGCAIQNSMLGAAHAAANPLTALFGTTHGPAVGLMMPHVVRFNSANGANPYSDLDADAERLARRLEELLRVAGLPRRLNEIEGFDDSTLPKLAHVAASQWTANFNPRKVGEAELLEIYRAAI